ncbi:acyltransferase [Prevotella stercorea]|uniref:acyltransferase family protein n=1 Tax=Leyella stercorea TaxID=363265 RepID=UPI001F33C937|nr:acyltransferase family protein [Leyella stercorea]MCF2577713.1 acyltransferase [Leyella stercorea]
MKIPDIELGNISRFRAEQMGAAMLFVILFHVALDRGDQFYGLRRCGNVGVDIFLFLSGVGLWFSWVKTPDVRRFYRRRLLRIVPTWLVVATAFYLPDYLGARRFSRSIVDLIGDITINWDFWLHDELTFWYVPAIMALYLVAPWYMRLVQSRPIYRWLPLLMVVWCVMVQWVLPIHHAVGHLEIFWSRVPIFFIGINFGELVRTRRQLPGESVWLLLLTFLMTFGTCLYLEQVRHGHFPLFVERMLYIPFTVCTVLVMNRIFRRTPQWVNSAFRFVGALSLEAYLIHIHFVLVYVQPYHMGYWPTFLITVAITLPIAWLLQRAIGFVSARL